MRLTFVLPFVLHHTCIKILKFPLQDYNHEAESLVSSLFLNPAEDDDLDIALKLAQVDMYTNNLRERARRKRVVRDYQLVSAFFASSRKDKTVKRKQSKEEKYV